MENLEQIESILPYYTLGNVPKSRTRPDDSRLVVKDRPKSSVSEALRAIRTNMQFLLPDSDKRVLTITSSIGGEGKTFISVNFGAILAASNKKVILLDLDMRKPQIHNSLSGEKHSISIQ